MHPQTGHEATDECPAELGVEGFGQRGRFHNDGFHLSHTHGAAPSDGAQSQVGKKKNLNRAAKCLWML